jgi:hypothetical protein
VAQRPEPSSEPQRRWPIPIRDIGLLLWAAFLAACVGTMVFFAFFDPVLLGHDGTPPDWLADRMTGYACGFFFFWGLCSVAAFLTAFMIDTQTNSGDGR